VGKKGLKVKIRHEQKKALDPHQMNGDGV